MSDPLVVDASVATKWLVPEADSALAEKLLEHAGPTYAPDLLLLEVANALWLKMRGGVLSEAEAHASLECLRSLSLIFWRGHESLAATIAMARRLDHAVYDCVYLALAQQVGAHVVTADRRFWNKTERDQELRGRVVMLDDWAGQP